MATTYIIYSPSMDRYYIGHTTGSMEERLRRHLTEHKGYTARAKDWEVVWRSECLTVEEAINEERRIKGMKSRMVIERLIREGRKGN